MAELAGCVDRIHEQNIPDILSAECPDYCDRGIGKCLYIIVFCEYMNRAVYTGEPHIQSILDIFQSVAAENDPV